MEQARKESNPISKIGNKLADVLSGGKNKEKEDTSSTEDGEKVGDKIDYNLPPCPKSLLGARVISIELAGLVAGTSNRGDFERKMKNLIKEASENNVILFIGMYFKCVCVCVCVHGFIIVLEYSIYLFSIQLLSDILPPLPLQMRSTT